MLIVYSKAYSQIREGGATVSAGTAINSATGYLRTFNDILENFGADMPQQDLEEMKVLKDTIMGKYTLAQNNIADERDMSRQTSISALGTAMAHHNIRQQLIANMAQEVSSDINPDNLKRRKISFFKPN